MRPHPHIEGTPWEVLGAAYGVCTWWVPSVCSEGIEVCVDEDGWAPPRARVLCELANVSEEDRVWFREGGRALADARARYGAPRGSGRWDDPRWGEIGEHPSILDTTTLTAACTRALDEGLGPLEVVRG